MPHAQFDRQALRFRPLGDRPNRVIIERDRVLPDDRPGALPAPTRAFIDQCAERVRAARQAGRPVIVSFGAHTIKNGLAPVLIHLMERGLITHLATNGAGIIHDWELAFQGASSEDVKANVSRGEFGLWEETGFYLNLALRIGAYEGLGYGESVGKMIQMDGLTVPAPSVLLDDVRRGAACSHQDGADWDRVAAAADLLDAIQRFKLQPGWMAIPHRWKGFCAQAAAFRLNVPFTGHPMIGHDIIYCHPLNHGAAIGRTALRDFLAFAEAIHNLQGGVYLSIGSAVMSPMIFEKSYSMSQNIEVQQGRAIDRHAITVVDLAELDWDWQANGEPPMDHPAYYQRYCKTFSRMGGEMQYICAHNRDFLLTLSQALSG